MRCSSSIVAIPKLCDTTSCGMSAVISEWTVPRLPQWTEVLPYTKGPSQAQTTTVNPLSLKHHQTTDALEEWLPNSLAVAFAGKLARHKQETKECNSCCLVYWNSVFAFTSWPNRSSRVYALNLWAFSLRSNLRQPLVALADMQHTLSIK